MDDQGEAITEDEFLERNIDVLGVSRQRQESQCKQRATHGTPFKEM
jgi:peroxiredoxin